jgi:hypothetical protein
MGVLTFLSLLSLSQSLYSPFHVPTWPSLPWLRLPHPTLPPPMAAHKHYVLHLSLPPPQYRPYSLFEVCISAIRI